MSNIAIIFAAGRGTRMKSSTPKQFLKIEGKPILAHTISIFETSPLIDKILIVTMSDKIKCVEEIIKQYKYKKVMDVIAGGTTAFKSQFNGLKYLKNNTSASDLILIHDGVRPLINNDTIINAIKLAKLKGNAVTVTPANETISINDKSGKVQKIEPRESCYIVRAPQVFKYGDIYNSHIKANKAKLSFVDSASLMKHYGFKLHTFIGPVENIKVTTMNDFVVCEYFLKRK